MRQFEPNSAINRPGVRDIAQTAVFYGVRHSTFFRAVMTLFSFDRRRSAGSELSLLLLRWGHSCAFLSRNAFAITETELKVIAALAIIGLSTIPKNG